MASGLWTVIQGIQREEQREDEREQRRQFIRKDTNRLKLLNALQSASPPALGSKSQSNARAAPTPITVMGPPGIPSSAQQSVQVTPTVAPDRGIQAAKEHLRRMERELKEVRIKLCGFMTENQITALEKSIILHTEMPGCAVPNCNVCAALN